MVLVTVALSLSALFSGCVRRVDVFSPHVDVSTLRPELEAAGARADATADSLERLGWLELLHGGTALEAVKAFERARLAGGKSWRLDFGLAMSRELLARPSAAAPAWARLVGCSVSELRRLAAYRLLGLLGDGVRGEAWAKTALAALDEAPLADPFLEADLRRALPPESSASTPPMLSDGTVARWRVLPRIDELPHLGFVRVRPERPLPGDDHLQDRAQGDRAQGDRAPGNTAPSGATEERQARSGAPDGSARVSAASARGRVGEAAEVGERAGVDEEGVLRFDAVAKGFFAAETELEVSAADGSDGREASREVEVALEMTTPLAARLLLGDRVVIERDAVGGFPPERREARVRLAPGTHRLRLEAAVSEAGEGVRVRALPLPPAVARPRQGSRGERLEGRLAAWVGAWLKLEEGDPVGARRALVRGFGVDRRSPGLRSTATRFPALRWLEAQIARRDPTVRLGVALERENAALSEAVDQDPTLAAARARLARQMLDEGRSAEALEHIAEGERVSPDASPWDRLRFLAFVDRGWQPEARQALTRALMRSPTDCELLKWRVDLDWDALRLRPWEPAPAGARGCARLRRAEAAFLLQRGRPDAAAGVYRALLDSSAGRMSDRDSLARALALAGRFVEAEAAYRALLAARSGDLDLRLQLAEVLRLAGHARRAAEERARLEARPEGQPDVRRRLLLVHDESFWGEFVQDGRAWVDGQRDVLDHLGRDADAVVALDQLVTRFYGDGSAMHYVHAVVQLRTQKGAEIFGELAIPDDAQILHARTLKPDGRAEEPEELAEKSTLSMPSLEPGDAIDYAYVTPAPPRAYAAPGVLSDTFFLQSYQAPILRSEWTVMVPNDMELAVEQRGPLASPVTRRVGPLRALTWRRTGSDQVRSEPEIPDARGGIAYVRVGSVSWPTLASRLADGVLPLLRVDPTLDELARTIASRHPGDLDAQAKAVYRVVTQEIEERTDLYLEASATSSYAEGRGERLIVLLALLRRLGVEAEIVLLKPLNRTLEDGAVPDVLAYSYPVVRARLDGDDVWLDPSLRFAPFGYLPPTLQGRPGLSLSFDEPGAAREAPRLPDEAELREVWLDLRVEPRGGGLEGEGRELVRGIHALTLRELLSRAGEEERLRAVTTLVRANVPDATVEHVSVGGLDDLDRPLELTYRLRAPLPPYEVPGPPQRVLLGLLRERFSAGFAQLAYRHHPLFFNARLEQRLELTLTIPEGAELVRVPRARRRDTSFGAHESRFWTTRTSEGVQQLHARKRLHVTPAIIAVERYPEFVWSCRVLDRSDLLAVDLRWRR